MKKVTKEEFYNVVEPVDAVVSTVGPFPYKSVFKLRHGKELGVVIGKRCEDNEEAEYFLNE